MFKIVKADGRQMTLDPNATTTVEKNNTLFNQSGELFQDLGYPSTAPPTEENKLFFEGGLQVESPNTVYRFPVQAFAESDVFLTGNIKYNIKQDSYDYNLEPNLVAIRALMKGRLTEIEAGVKVVFNENYTGLENHMMATALNPDNYNYIFFPVRNLSFVKPFYRDSGGHGFDSVKKDYVNNYDFDELRFQTNRTLSGSNIQLYAYCPFYKLTYLIKELAAYLGLTPVGSFFTDPKYKNYVIYTRNCGDELGNIMPWPKYMPNMTIEDFFAQLGERLHLAIEPNLTTLELQVDSWPSIANSLEPFDLTPYIQKGSDTITPDGVGYLVTLKSDENDMAMEIDLGTDTTYPPLYNLKVGDGSTPVELACSTTNDFVLTDAHARGARCCMVDQSVVCKFAATADDSADTITQVPADIALSDPEDPTTLNNWPLRLMEYLGFNHITDGGYYFPESQSVNLDASDLAYWKWKNDSKQQTLLCLIPAAILSGMKSTFKYVYRSPEMNYAGLIAEKIAYDLKLVNEMVPVTITAWTLDNPSETPGAITKLSAAYGTADGVIVGGALKAYFDPDIHFIDELEVQIFSPGGLQLTVAPVKIQPTAAAPVAASPPFMYRLPKMLMRLRNSGSARAHPAIYHTGAYTIRLSPVAIIIM